jgi:hypothetical protein
MLSFKYCGLDPALFARADFLRRSFLWAFLATRIFPVAVKDARFFKYDLVFNFGIFTSLFYIFMAMPLPFQTFTRVYSDTNKRKIKFLLNINFFLFKLALK